MTIEKCIEGLEKIICGDPSWEEEHEAVEAAVWYLRNLETPPLQPGDTVYYTIWDGESEPPAFRVYINSVRSADADGYCVEKDARLKYGWGEGLCLDPDAVDRDSPFEIVGQFYTKGGAERLAEALNRGEKA